MKRRVRRMRRMHSPPAVKGFSPFGSVQNLEDKTVYLLLEEYESIRLCDYDMITHQEASVIMGISRPTFTRIYASARQKVAKAFVEGLKISIEGGKVYFDSDWYHCQSCNCDFSNPDKTTEVKSCPLCGSKSFTHYQDDESKSPEIVEKDLEDCFNSSENRRHGRRKGKNCRENIQGKGRNLV